MKKFLFVIFFFVFINSSNAQNITTTYFAGGCFWCMEESFEKTEGIIEVISGYSGGITENPTYKEVTYGDTGHFETVKISFNNKIISYKKVLDIFWKNIDPFDAAGQFCDKGYSYRSVAFYQNQEQKKIIENRIKEIELEYNKSVVTYVKGFDKFYKAEDYHQNYYQTNFINYLLYKKGCGRENRLEQIWEK